MSDWYRGEIVFLPIKPHHHYHGRNNYIRIFTHARRDRFILSDDIQTNSPHTSVGPDTSHAFDGYKITCFGSTDQGISLLLETHEGTFFFAGDLNAWIWPEDDEETQIKERDDFLRELDKIKVYPVDLACVPADPRLGENFAEGVRLFDKIVNPRAVIIHFQTTLTPPPPARKTPAHAHHPTQTPRRLRRYLSHQV